MKILPITGSPDALMHLTADELTNRYCRVAGRLAYFRLMNAPAEIVEREHARCEIVRIALGAKTFRLAA